jgi:dipeptide/tripeptide permease
MMVNIGSFLGPLFTMVAEENSASSVFYFSAGLISLNFIMLLFYKEPDRVEPEGDLLDAIRQVFTRILTVFRDWKFVLFLSIIAIFWAMYFQLFYTLPVFITQWVDSSAIKEFFSDSEFIMKYYTSGDQMKPEFITNMDAMFIILFQVIVSYAVMRMKPLSSIMTGIIVNAIGLSLTFVTQNVFFVIAAMLIFGLGEMAASPKVTEYIGRIAPKDKKALYMGFSFVPLFLGGLMAGVLSGPVYQSQSDLTIMTKEYAVEKNFQIDEELSQNAYLAQVAKEDGKTVIELKQYFWETNNPSKFWYSTLASGILAMLLLFLYDRFLLSKE